ncbi:MAG TPA: hypothetical protein VFN31_02280 [Candidatus Saccharimonadales bacterium]|nr:hypothetical protein [Candidatus Saccharimonadales bacterium]
MIKEPLTADGPERVNQACKDANIALALAIISIYGSTIPFLGIVTALVAERIAYNTPSVKGIANIETKKNVVHYLTPFTFVLSLIFLIFYYYLYNNHHL